MKLSYILLFVTVVCVALAKRPKKPGSPPSIDDLQDQIEELRKDFKELRDQVATTGAKSTGFQDDIEVQRGHVNIHLHGKDDHVMSSKDDPNDHDIHLHMHVDGCPGHDHDDDHHQHHHNKTVVSGGVTSSTDGSLDKYHFGNDTDEIHAHCDFITNIDLPEAEREHPHGYVHFSQKLSGGPVDVHVHVDGFKVHNSSDDIHEHEMHVHEMHVHEGSDPEHGCDHLKGYFDPHHDHHDDGTTAERHTGDIGNITVDDHGNVHVNFSNTGISLMEPDSIIGHSVVIHHLHMETGESGKHGNAGTRVACCKISKVPGHVIDDVADGHDHKD